MTVKSINVQTGEITIRERTSEENLNFFFQQVNK